MALGSLIAGSLALALAGAPLAMAAPKEPSAKSGAKADKPRKEGDKPRKEKARTDKPAKDAPAKDAPTKDAPTKDAPAKDAPAKDAPAKDAPAKDAPAKDAPAKDAPGEESPGKEPTSDVDVDAEDEEHDHDDATPSAPPKDDAKPPPEKKAEEEEIVRQGSTRHLDVVARSLRLKKSARARLLAIAAHYHAATGKKLIITGGDRDARTQAKLMYRKVEAGEDLLTLYKKTHLVKPIVDAYAAAKETKHTEKTVLRAMTKVIQKQIDEGEFVSRHLEFSAADVRSRDLTDKQVQAVEAAVAAVAGASLVDEREGTAPHLHLNL